MYCKILYIMDSRFQRDTQRTWLYMSALETVVRGVMRIDSHSNCYMSCRDLYIVFCHGRPSRQEYNQNMSAKQLKFTETWGLKTRYINYFETCWYRHRAL